MKSVYTVAEVTRIKKQEQLHGMKLILEPMLNVMCLELLDNQNLSKDQVKEVNKRMQKMLESINSGNCDIQDIKDTLKEEYDIEIKMGGI